MVEHLPFFHARPIVPIPPGLEPMRNVMSTSPASLPEDVFGEEDHRPRHWYSSSVSISPGIRWATWNEWRAIIEAHRGFPHPYRPEYSRAVQEPPVDAVTLTTRVLPPPPRPAVYLDGPHTWVVYVGRRPAVYNDM